jgi:cell wall-associated NlpC family hydrolase
MRHHQRISFVMAPFMLAVHAKDNTGEFRAIAQEASDATPPPFRAQDLLVKPTQPPQSTPPRRRTVRDRLGVRPKPPAPPPPPPPAPAVAPQPRVAVQGKAQQVIQAARNLLGIPYVFGGESTSGIDCSGFTQRAYGDVGIELPRTAAAQAAAFPQVSDPQPGDLVYWSSPESHVMIYYGNGLVIGAHHTGTVSSISPIYGSPSFHRVVS